VVCEAGVGNCRLVAAAADTATQADVVVVSW
jgi:hypothetical protein